MKRYLTIMLIAVIAAVAFTVTAQAGVAEIIGTVKTSGIVTGLVLVALMIAFRVFPNKTIYGIVRNTFTGIGVIVTGGLSRYSLTKPLWNKHIEPWFVDFLTNTVLAAVDGFVAGLKSDNTPIDATADPPQYRDA